MHRWTSGEVTTLSRWLEWVRIPYGVPKTQVLATVLNWRASRPIWLGQAGPATSRLLEKIGAKVFVDAHQPVTLEEGDRYPLVPPSHAPLVKWYNS